MKRLIERLGFLFVGIAIHRVCNSLFVFALVPFVLSYFDYDYLKGILWLIICSLFYCRFFVFMYDFFQKDLFMIEHMKSVSEDTEESVKSSIVKKIEWARKRGSYFILVILLAWDPTIVGIYYREGSHKYDGLNSRKVKGLFLVSSVISTMISVFQISIMVLLFDFFFKSA